MITGSLGYSLPPIMQKICATFFVIYKSSVGVHHAFRVIKN